MDTSFTHYPTAIRAVISIFQQEEKKNKNNGCNKGRESIPDTAGAFFTVQLNPLAGTDDANFPELLRRIQFTESSENSPSPILLDGEAPDDDGGDVPSTDSDWL